MAVLESIGIAGAGRVAQALGRLLATRGEPVVAVASRDPEHALAAARFIGGAAAVSYRELPGRASNILIAVSDDAIAAVARLLADAGMRDGAALHTCGAHGPEILAPLSRAGVSCGALHPLQTVASPEQGLRALKGAAFGITAEGAAARWAARIVEAAGGEPLEIPAHCRPLYHAAAVMAGNYIIGLIDAAAALLRMAGLGERQALRALAPLARASLDNALELGPAEALTGPVQRGDAETVAAHWRALSAAPEPFRELYRAAARSLLPLAVRRGVSPSAVQYLEQLLH